MSDQETPSKLDVEMAWDEYDRLVDRFYEQKCTREEVIAARTKAEEIEARYMGAKP